MEIISIEEETFYHKINFILNDKQYNGKIFMIDHLIRVSNLAYSDDSLYFLSKNMQQSIADSFLKQEKYRIRNAVNPYEIEFV